MLEKIPSAIGHALRGARPGVGELMSNDESLRGVPELIQVASSAFGEGQAIPARYSADGESVSPPLSWQGTPDDTEALVLLIEDADSPTPHPLVHAIVWDLAPSDGELTSGALSSSEPQAGLGRNSYFKRTYLPLDPPRGHGPHRYAFQLFACDCSLTFEDAPGRTALREALRGHVLAKGCLIGTYERV
jgi:Raf kinase inhibitor-like YbhB/YbcL family protein